MLISTTRTTKPTKLSRLTKRRCVLKKEKSELTMLLTSNGFVTVGVTTDKDARASGDGALALL